MKEKFKRFIAVLLALGIILPVQELEVFAETVSKNEVIEEDSNNEQVTNPIEMKTVSEGDVEEETFFKTDVAGKELSHTGKNEERMPSAPIHHHAPDYTDFSYVYFGSYPQSEITDSTTIATIENAISASGAESGADVGIDILIDGIKYRRIGKSDTDYDRYFGYNDYRYFKWEKIKWKVLQNDGNTLVIVANEALDSKRYHDAGGAITWEGSSIRNWLNDSFYNIAFNSKEQEVIVEQTVVNKDSPYGTEGGNDTSDKVYLLSIDEVTEESYGFCWYSGDNSQSRMITVSDYSHARGAGDGYWWLRSPGSRSNSAAYVNDRGYVDRSEHYVDGNSDGVCPVLHINLQSDFWSVSEEGIPANPIHHCPSKEGIIDYTDWDYIYFGSYPQSEVTDSAVIADIENAIHTSGAETSVDIGIDVWVDGIKYRRIGKGDVNNDGYYENSDYRYFQWERVKWKVLQSDGNTLFVASDKALDCKDYHDVNKEITWEGSSIRNWLNDNFYNTAFSSEEKEAIVEQNVVNKDNPDYGTKGGNDTKDKIYLLSLDEVTEESYGFCSDDGIDSESRRIKVSDYSNVRGTWKNGYGNCAWWLRSPGDSNYRATSVIFHRGGVIYRAGDDVDSDRDGVCPALHINLSSDLWLEEDDGTSGEGGSYGKNILMGLQASKKKTEYMQGENFNLDDLTVTAVYENSSKVLSAGSYTTNASVIDMNTPGSKTLTISYTEGTITKTAAITITVTPKTDTAPIAKKGTKITDKASAATYKVTNPDSEAPTVEYTAPTNKKKKTITIPEYVTYQGVKYKVTSVSAKSFKGNKKLTTIKIASSITKIGDSAFEGCTGLKTVTIGIGLKTIGKNAFKNCKKLKTLTIKSSKLKTVGKNAFKGIYAKCKIKVPAKKVKAYQKLMKKKGQAATVKVKKSTQ